MAKVSTLYRSERQRENLQAVQSLSFTEITEDHISLLKSFFDRYPSRSCDFTTGGIMIWRKMFKYEYAIIEDSLIIKGYLPESNIYVFYSPVGKINIKSFMELISEYCIAQGIDAMIIMTEEEQIGIDQPKESYFAEYMPDYKEYLYDINKFRGFPGKKMEKKRNHLHYFEKNYSPYEFKAIGRADINDLIEFTLKFENNHNDSEISEYECEEIINVLRNYDKYPFEGILIKKEGRLLGYTFGEKSGDTFIIHAEKGDISYRGIYQALASEFAKYLADKYPEIKYLNREDDMGDESLRKSKESYHPCIYVHKHRYFVR